MNTIKLSVIVLAILFSAVIPAKAEDPVVFADANLKAAVVEELQKTDPTITDPTPTDMLYLTRLYADVRNIVDLTGLEYATNLKYLFLHNNEISNISALSGLTNLRFLTLRNNEISDISDVSGLRKLPLIHLK